eukprot:m.1688 g.1688  ORF g.1688 m.1688 type:complete len:194 (-) comp394_c0_seq1:46-627(-)
MFDVFVSYRHADAAFARALEQRLTALGLHVFIDEGNTMATDFREAYTAALKHSKFAALVVSEGTIARFGQAGQAEDHVLHEWELAVRQRELGKLRILPIMVASSVPDDPALKRPFAVPPAGAFADIQHAGGLGRPVAETVAQVFTNGGMHVWDPSRVDFPAWQIQQCLYTGKHELCRQYCEQRGVGRGQQCRS